MLIPRIITAIVLAVVVIWGVFFLPLESFSIGVLVVMLLGLFEWVRLCKHGVSTFLLSAAGMLALVVSFIFLNPINPAIFLAGALLFWLYKLLSLGKPLATGRSRCVVEGIAALFFAWVGFVMLKAHQTNASALVMLALLMVWSADTFAYFGGKRFGKTKLAPSISPGKTREGVLAGSIGAVVVSVVFSALFLNQVNSFEAYLALILIAIFVSLIAVVGDLSESKLKRAADMKDSGKLLPGHGGVLDRIDGLIAGVPIFTFYWWCLNQFGLIA